MGSPEGKSASAWFRAERRAYAHERVQIWKGVSAERQYPRRERFP
jgi:hypothetical protein